jgi:Zn-dependent peptidase ImmA (M78 family)
VAKVIIVESDRWHDGYNEVRAETFNRDIYLGRSTFALAHELGHAYLLWKTGDADPNHARWDSSNNSQRDQEYFKRYETLP